MCCGSHLSRNYPQILVGGKSMGSKHGQFRKEGRGNEDNHADAGVRTDAGWRGKVDYEELPLSNLDLTMLQRLGVEPDRFADSTGTFTEV